MEDFGLSVSQPFKSQFVLTGTCLSSRTVFWNDFIKFLLQGIYMFLQNCPLLIMLPSKINQLQLQFSFGLVLNRTESRWVLAGVGILLLDLALVDIDWLADRYQISIFLLMFVHSSLDSLTILQHLEVALSFFVEIGLGGVESAF